MPHKIVTFEAWIEQIADEDPCLGTIIEQAAIAHDYAVKAGAAAKATAPRACFKKFESAVTTMETLKAGTLKPKTQAAWKRASDALRKFTEAMDCMAAPAPRGNLAARRARTSSRRRKSR